MACGSRKWRGSGQNQVSFRNHVLERFNVFVSHAFRLRRVRMRSKISLVSINAHLRHCSRLSAIDNVVVFWQADISSVWRSEVVYVPGLFRKLGSPRFPRAGAQISLVVTRTACVPPRPKYGPESLGSRGRSWRTRSLLRTVSLPSPSLGIQGEKAGSRATPRPWAKRARICIQRLRACCSQRGSESR